MDAGVLIRRQEGYPWADVKSGLEVLGYRVQWDRRDKTLPLIITWNNYGASASVATAARLNGGVHVVMENGYVSGSKHSPQFTVSRDGYNGLGWIPDIPDDNGNRWKQLGIQLHPWRSTDTAKHILVCAQRGGNYSELAMSNDWPDEILTTLRTVTDRPIWYRPHPGRPRIPKLSHKNVRIVNPKEPLFCHLQKAYATVVWTSFSALHSVINGVPAFYCGPNFIGKAVCLQGVTELDDPFYPEDRLSFFNRLAWHQWSGDELANGTAWRFVLGASSVRSANCG